MAVTDPIADMLAKIKNASSAGHESVNIRPSRMKLEIIKILKIEGYIKNFKKVNADGHTSICVFLKYDGKQEPIIQGIQRVSKPGRRIYSGYRDMPRVFNGYGTLVVSTSSGVTTGRRARERKAGGELLCTVW
ncbi:MAG: 30S ribosomal protein S8 [Spirochaetaceae bacterium]|nr:30S ribosomal protein S8 [Spirochaetaceae bacterium]MDE0229229.1 30S ribosomal protein S8 [Spirochaetaceae bacterium]MDE0446691.1 30S ribosomal protein S8 [Spirochaetaceae bacterium]